MIDQILRSIFVNQWSVILIVSATLLAAAEIGYRGGLRLFRRKDESGKAQVAGVQGAVLGLLGLLLGFTFAMAVSRFDQRRQLVLQEANAIGTTYLRVSFLAPSDQPAIRDLLRRYLDARLAFFDAGTDAGKQAESARETEQLQNQIWERSTASAKNASPLTALYFNALNEVIDMDASRLTALNARIPGTVWLLLLLVAAVGCCLTGYGTGAGGGRVVFSCVVLPLLIAVVITLIVDLNLARHGLILESQAPLLNLRMSLQRTSPS